MTYKAIVKEMIRREAERWVCSIMDENNISYKWTSSETTDIEADKDSNGFLWEAKVDVYGRPGCGNGYIRMLVGGSVDDMIGICCSVIWSADKKTIIWMASEETRKDLGITEFRLPIKKGIEKND